MPVDLRINRPRIRDSHSCIADGLQLLGTREPKGDGPERGETSQLRKRCFIQGRDVLFLGLIPTHHVPRYRSDMLGRLQP
jgi:hypothetical protein